VGKYWKIIAPTYQEEIFYGKAVSRDMLNGAKYLHEMFLRNAEIVGREYYDTDHEAGTRSLEQFLHTNLSFDSACNGDPVQLGLISKGACVLIPILHLLFGAYSKNRCSRHHVPNVRSYEAWTNLWRYNSEDISIK